MKYAKCKLCDQVEVFIKMTAGNTSGIKRHIENKHPEEYGEFYDVSQISEIKVKY